MEELKTGIDCKGREWHQIKLDPRRANLTGQIIDQLTPLYPVNADSSHHSRWLCQCSCGNLTLVRTEALEHKTAHSCGCMGRTNVKKALTLDLTGQRFGKLVALYQVENIGLEVYWHCKCDCGNEKDIQRAALTSGTTKSCGCVSSYKEEEINEILINNNIEFLRQYRLKDCKDKKPLPFDFAIFKNNQLVGLIEYQGSQHYEQRTVWDTVEDFNIRINHDKIKKEYCKNNNIPLLILNKNNNLLEEITLFINKL